MPRWTKFSHKTHEIRILHLVLYLALERLALRVVAPMHYHLVSVGEHLVTEVAGVWAGGRVRPLLLLTLDLRRAALPRGLHPDRHLACLQLAKHLMVRQQLVQLVYIHRLQHHDTWYYTRLYTKALQDSKIQVGPVESTNRWGVRIWHSLASVNNSRLTTVTVIICSSTCYRCAMRFELLFILTLTTFTRLPLMLQWSQVYLQSVYICDGMI